MAKALVITEKPSVARDISDALGGFTEHDGYFESEETVVTFAVGHLFELLEPEEVDERYKRWTLDVLPILPERFDLKKKKGQSDRIRVIQRLAKRDDVDRLVNACDAGREGELIFREVVRYLGVQKPVERLWLQSMTTEAIRRGFRRLIPGAELEGLGQAAECRAYSDWLIGMNATRALTKRFATRKDRTAWSAGRVQTPTLALLVDREFEVLAHVPEPYWRVEGSFEHEGHAYTGQWFDPDFRAGDDERRRDDWIFDEARARAIVEAATGQPGRARESRKPSRESAPPLFDLTSLQREGNRRFGWSARRTLGAAQRCYEAHKILTYPRTDSRCLPSDYRGTVEDVLRSFAASGSELADGDYAASARHLLEAGLQNESRIFDDRGVSDHFAIVPTGSAPRGELRGDDRRLYDLVVRRFLGAFFPPAVWERVERVTEVSGESFRTRARTLVEPGWRTALPRATEDGDEASTLPPLAPGQTEAEGVGVVTRGLEVIQEETKPPPRISEARLLSLMENAGQQVDDEDLAAVLHAKGIGTPATRAEIIENLIRKGYVVRVGKALRPTVKGIRLIDSLRRIHIDRLASPALTGELEQHLLEVEHGERSAEAFMEEITSYAVEVVERAKSFEYEELYGADPPLGTCPFGGRPVVEQAWFYTCKKDPSLPREAKADPSCPHESCPLLLWKDTSGRYLDRAAAAALLRDGRTGILDGFTARNGRTYKGHLELDPDEGKVKVVSEGWNEEASTDVAEYDVNTEPLGRCPFGEDCEVIETPTHFSCRRRLKSDEIDAAFREARRRARESGEPPPDKPEKPEHCGFVLPRTVCKREMTRDEAIEYLRTGRTALIDDFTSRFGRPFAATLVLKETGRHGFEFPPRGGARGRAGRDGSAESGDEEKSRRRPTTRKAGSKPRKAAGRRGRSAAKSSSAATEKSPGKSRKRAGGRAPSRGAKGRKRTPRKPRGE